MRLLVLKGGRGCPLTIRGGVSLLHRTVGPLHAFCACDVMSDAMATQVFMDQFLKAVHSFIPSFMDRRTWKNRLNNIFETESTLILKNQILL